jgi:Secretion system C-terminal sorting domain
MIRLILWLLFAAVCSIGYAQNTNTSSNNTESYLIIRSSIGLSGSSNTITTNNGRYIVSQSIGQSSVIGTHSNNGYILRQGYQQPSILSVIPQSLDDKNLKASIYPNPFQQIVTISFSELMIDDVSIIVFDINGRLILSQKHPPSQLIKLSFNEISSGNYLIKISSNGKQFSAKLIKR